MKTRRTNQRSPDAATRLANEAQRRGAPAVQRAQDALAHSPRLAAQRQAIRAAFGAAAGLVRQAPVQRMVAVAAADLMWIAWDRWRPSGG